MPLGLAVFLLAASLVVDQLWPRQSHYIAWTIEILFIWPFMTLGIGTLSWSFLLFIFGVGAIFNWPAYIACLCFIGLPASTLFTYLRR